MRTIPEGYRIVKWDKNLDLKDVEGNVSIYNITHRRHYGKFECTCPQGRKAPYAECKHKQMVAIFCSHRAVDTSRFYNYDTGEWR